MPRSRLKVKMAVLGSPSLIILMVSVVVKQHRTVRVFSEFRSSVSRGGRPWLFSVQELCESRGGRSGLPVLMSLMVSVDVKQH